MKNWKKRMYDAWLWVIRWFRIEKKAIHLLRGMDANDIKAGQLYEHYGRIFVAEKVEKPVVINYYIQTTTDMSAVAADMIVQNMEYLEPVMHGAVQMYKTHNQELAEWLMEMRGVEVSEEIENEPCHNCDIARMFLPCPNCEFRHIYRVLREKKQNATDQEQWLRVQRKKLGLE